ncbi:PucR family transcriptional regulator [Actinophytocola sp. NPDC049390]|uniref:PucR family transcriptional regulator n=1 Tax=Actinophytocola sp. NPDC049390 TaxID=3363894 RepID=UPI0037A4A507
MTELPHRVGTRTATSLVADVLSRVPELTDALVTLIGEQNPGYRRMKVVPPHDLWQSCHDNLTRVLQLVSRAAGEEPDGTDLYDAARATGRQRAQQRMPLDDVLRSFRLGGRLVWEALIHRARAGELADPDELLNLASWVWTVVDDTSAQVAIAYHATERELVRVDEQRRATLWEGLLHGRAKEPAFALQAAQSIGVPVDGPYTVVVLDAETGDNRTGSALECGLAEAGVVSVWQARAGTLVGLLAVADTTVALRVLRADPRVPVGVSMTVPSLADVDVAYRQAVLARNTVPPGRVEVAALADRLPEALLLSAPALAEALIERRLGPLLKVPLAERRLLLDTLNSWLETGGSINQTANAVHCHRNTVINRLRRVETITGLDLADTAAHLELSLALRASWLLPPGPLA